MNDDWICGFCLALSTDLETHPDRCERCEMTRCHECGTWLKERDGKQSKFCHGCGTISPTTSARFSRTSSISCCYVEREWMRRNLGGSCDGLYAIATGWKDTESRKLGKSAISSWITKENGGEREHIRELTEEEKKIIKGD